MMDAWTWVIFYNRIACLGIETTDLYYLHGEFDAELDF